MARVLGIDCSSNTIGYCILDIDKNNNIKFIEASYIKPPKKGNIVERIASARNSIQDLLVRTQPTHIAVEEIIQFMKGASTAKTIIALTSFNRAACLCAYDYLGRAPELFNVMSIRHGIKLSKELPKKDEIPQIIEKHLNIDFPYEFNRKNDIKPESYDMSDGCAVALYYSFILTGKIKVKKKK